MKNKHFKKFAKDIGNLWKILIKKLHQKERLTINNRYTLFLFLFVLHTTYTTLNARQKIFRTTADYDVNND